VKLCVGCWTVDVAPSPKFHDHEVELPFDVSVKRIFPLVPDSALLKFAASGTGVGVGVAVFVTVGVAVAVAVAVGVGVAIVVVVTVAAGVGVSVVVAVVVTVVVGVVLVVVTGVAVRVADSPFTRSSLAITTPDVASTNRTAIGPAGRETNVAPVSEPVRTKPEPV
jgi:hypothetical protein